MKKLASIVGTTQEQQLEYIRLNYFTNRYREHKNSIPFNRKQLRQIRTEIKILLGRNKKLAFDELEFLVDIANLVIRARRSLSYTYALRFYIRGESKQRFFDFIQGDLERSLELLNDKSE